MCEFKHSTTSATITSYDFGSFDPRDGAVGAVTVRNTGGAASGTCTVGFSGATASDVSTPSNSCTNGIGAGSSCSVGLVLTTDYDTAGVKVIPMTVTCGSGGSQKTATVNLTYTITGSPTDFEFVDGTNTTVGFGTQYQGCPSTAHVFQIVNTGTQALANCSSPTLSNLSDFTMSNYSGCTGGAATGATCDALTITPKTTTTGTKTGTISMSCGGVSKSISVSITVSTRPSAGHGNLAACLTTQILHN